MYPSPSDNPPPDDDADERVQHASIRTGFEVFRIFRNLIDRSPGFDPTSGRLRNTEMT
jgi:hypothetical protein